MMAIEVNHIQTESDLNSSKCKDPDTDVRNRTCKMTFESMLACNSRFLDQAMLNSDPFTVCNSNETRTSHNWTLIYYESLKNDHEPKDPKVFCSSLFLSKNRMELVVNTIEYSKNVWDQANCDNCHGSDESSKDTNYFFEKLHKYDACVNDSTSKSKDNNVTCQNCVNQYLNLTAVYDDIKTKYGYYKICFDIQDKVSLQFLIAKHESVVIFSRNIDDSWQFDTLFSF